MFPGLLQECKLFNMETVDKLEAMFQKAEADIEYVEKRLKYDFMASAREAGTFEVTRHAALCAQVEEIAAEQKRSMDSIRTHLDTTVQMVQQLQSTAEMEVPPLTQAEQEARDALCSAVAALNVEAESQSQPQAQETAKSKNIHEDVCEGTFEAVPRSVRGNLKLNDLNLLYKQILEYFSDKTRGPMSSQKMKKLNMNVSDPALKTLKHLKIIELDKKGLTTLVQKD
ncbi:hypothetical protein DNTS_033435 [Danionella cerebrum]|uniref:Protein FAM33A n=1 Tax=Danionella cerebrum TaxID=2873325 RepID=A0A553R925_9TELE|nr:hypothetical protein DNTS_033435 [Danionella translucida]TRY98688.1 hypothetical protein DNTS_033435 [Danionella translucida]